MTAHELKIKTEFKDKSIWGVFFINQDLIAISYDDINTIDIRNKDDLSLILTIPFTSNVYSFNKTALYYLFGANTVLLVTNH